MKSQQTTKTATRRRFLGSAAATAAFTVVPRHVLGGAGGTAPSETVNVAVLLGPTGPMAAHTPDICYSGRDYSIDQRRQHAKIRPEVVPDETFWMLTLRSKDIHGNLLRVYYGWRREGAWVAPKHARFALSGRPYIHKIQLACPLPIESALEDTDPGREFLKAFLPVADRILAP